MCNSSCIVAIATSGGYLKARLRECRNSCCSLQQGDGWRKFKSIDELANVKGIGEGLIKKNRKYMSVKGGLAKPSAAASNKSSSSSAKSTSKAKTDTTKSKSKTQTKKSSSTAKKSTSSSKKSGDKKKPVKKKKKTDKKSTT